jgi:hypothetical protein
MRQQILGEDKLENDRTSVGVVFSNNQGSYVLCILTIVVESSRVMFILILFAVARGRYIPGSHYLWKRQHFYKNIPRYEEI